MKDLTFLLLVKGRKSFSLRWLDYLSEHKSKFKIYIADGSKQEQNLEHYSFNLNCDYEYYGEDKDIKTFLKKIVNSLKKIKTKYVMMCSNDDFVINNNINDLLEKLKSNNESICIKGRSLWFNLSHDEDLNGQISNFSPFQTPHNLQDDSMVERIKVFTNNYNGNWHAIIQKDILFKIFNYAYKNEIFDMFMLENFFNIVLVLEGKIIASEKPYLFNQDHLNRLSHNKELLKYDIEKIRGVGFKDLVLKYVNTELSNTNLRNDNLWSSIDNLLFNHFYKKKNILNHIDISKLPLQKKIKHFIIKVFAGSIFFKIYVKVKFYKNFKNKKNKDIIEIVNKINEFLSKRKKIFKGYI
tara:strand:+ start:1546 stop:2607 length:1062 start_codon:yes stop_codon:yes gene_type:complete